MSQNANSKQSDEEITAEAFRGGEGNQRWESTSNGINFEWNQLRMESTSN